MSQRRHEPYEELMSASLAGDLSRAEREQLNAHLRTCPACRATMTAYREDRRLVAGLRHVPPPRNLHARVRVGVERGVFASVPWWRRPAAALIGIAAAGAVAAGALLAVVLLNDASPPEVGQETASPTVTIEPSPTVEPTTSPEATPPPSTPQPTPTPTPQVGAGAINFLAVNGPSQADKTLTLDRYVPTSGEEGSPLRMNEEPKDTIAGPPVAVSLAPTYGWLAYQTQIEAKGTNQIWAVHLGSGREYLLGETPDDSAFSRRMAWSPDGRYLAYTAAGAESGVGPDVWIFETHRDGVEEPAEGEEPLAENARQLTDTESTYAASFAADGEGAARLWVSTAAETPVSRLIELPRDAELPEPQDPAEFEVLSEAQAIFQPILSPMRDYAVFWRGGMAQGDDLAWRIATGGMLYLSGEPVDGEVSWGGDEPLFADLEPVGRDALGSAYFAWSFDNDTFAVWDVDWRGIPREDGSGSAYPARNEVYIGSADDRRLISAGEDDWHLAVSDPEREFVVSVAFVGPDDSTIAVTVFESPGGESGDSPIAASRLVVMPTLAAGGANDTGILGEDKEWAGPAFYVPQGTEQGEDDEGQ